MWHNALKCDTQKIITLVFFLKITKIWWHRILILVRWSRINSFLGWLCLSLGTRGLGGGFLWSYPGWACPGHSDFRTKRGVIRRVVAIVVISETQGRGNYWDLCISYSNMKIESDSVKDLNIIDCSILPINDQSYIYLLLCPRSAYTVQSKM